MPRKACSDIEGHHDGRSRRSKTRSGSRQQGPSSEEGACCLQGRAEVHVVHSMWDRGCFDDSMLRDDRGIGIMMTCDAAYHGSGRSSGLVEHTGDAASCAPSDPSSRASSDQPRRHLARRTHHPHSQRRHDPQGAHTPRHDSPMMIFCLRRESL
eukprot:59401-Rhodomonas_salina.4